MFKVGDRVVNTALIVVESRRPRRHEFIGPLMRIAPGAKGTVEAVVPARKDAASLHVSFDLGLRVHAYADNFKLDVPGLAAYEDQLRSLIAAKRAAAEAASVAR